MTALSLILSLAETKKFIPDPLVYQWIFDSMEKAKDPSISLSGYCTLKQLQTSFSVELKELVWRPRNADDFDYFCALLKEIHEIELREGKRQEGYIVDEREEARKRKRIQAEDDKNTRGRKKKKVEGKLKEMEVDTQPDSEPTTSLSLSSSPSQTRLGNLQLILKYFIGIFHENLSLGVPAHLSLFSLLLRSDTIKKTSSQSYGANETDRVRRLVSLCFDVLACGGCVSCSLANAILSMLMSIYGLADERFGSPFLSSFQLSSSLSPLSLSMSYILKFLPALSRCSHKITCASPLNASDSSSSLSPSHRVASPSSPSSSPSSPRRRISLRSPYTSKRPPSPRRRSLSTSSALSRSIARRSSHC